MKEAIVCNNLNHSYGKVNALTGLNFTVGHNELFGLIGPDGAGKTTLFRIAATLLVPKSGEICIMGFDSVKDYRELRKITGYMPGRFSLYHDLTVEENLKFFAAIFGTTVKENYRLIAPIYEQIAPFRKRLAGKLSGGMKQKLALSCALVHKPKILILDEPTTGVDAVSRSEFWEMLSGLNSEGITIIVSTPYMDEALKCDRVALIQSGKILGMDSPGNIQKDYKKNLFSARHELKYKLLLALKNIAQTTSLLAGDPQPFGETVHITVAEGITPAEIIKVLESEGIPNAIIKKISPGIEDVFLEKMKHP